MAEFCIPQSERQDDLMAGYNDMVNQEARKRESILQDQNSQKLADREANQDLLTNNVEQTNEQRQQPITKHVLLQNQNTHQTTRPVVHENKSPGIKYSRIINQRSQNHVVRNQGVQTYETGGNEDFFQDTNGDRTFLRSKLNHDERVSAKSKLNVNEPVSLKSRLNQDDATLTNKSSRQETNSSANKPSCLKRKSALMKLPSYFLATRPWSFSASLMPTMIGCAISYRLTGPEGFSWITMILTMLIVACVHGAGNVVNTYYDFVKGVDSRISDDRVLVDHLLTAEELTSLGVLLYVCGTVSVGVLTFVSSAKLELLALIYFGGLSSSFMYTGGIGLKYIALGDIVILTIFGPMAVLFAFFAQTGYVEWNLIYYAIPLALNAEAILHSNNTRDLESDKKAGIVTLAILIGYAASHVLYAFLLFTPYVMLVIFAMKYSFWFLLPVITVFKAFEIEKRFRNQRTIRSVPKETANLNVYLGFLYLVSCLLVKKLPFLPQTAV